MSTPSDDPAQALDSGGRSRATPTRRVLSLEYKLANQWRTALHALDVRLHHGGVTHEQGSPGDEPARTSRHLADANAFVVVTNAVFAGLAGTYAATQSVVVTAVAAGLVASVGLLAAYSRRHHH